MKAYLVYWTPEGCHRSDLLLHAASEQFHKLRRGDQLYVITCKDGFEFLGRIIVDQVVGHLEAASNLGVAPEELWPASLHALAARETATPIVSVPCEEVLRRIYVVSGGKPTRVKEPLVPQRFQAIREITPGSARLFDELLPASVPKDRKA